MTTANLQTRDRILEAAEAVFADNGYHDAIVDEIGRRTSLSKGGLYFHFPSKEGLFFAVLDRLADRLVNRAEEAASREGPALERAERHEGGPSPAQRADEIVGVLMHGVHPEAVR